MLVPAVSRMWSLTHQCSCSPGSQSDLPRDERVVFSHTSVGFDVLDVSLGVCDLNGGSGHKLFVPAAHVVVEVDDAEVVVYSQVLQNGLHGLHCLREQRGLNALLKMQNDRTKGCFSN